jgi:hypothetical protein
MLKSPGCKRIQGGRGGAWAHQGWASLTPQIAAKKKKDDTKTLDKTFTIVYNKCIR